MLASTAEAEDVVHDLFVDLARNRQKLDRVTDLDGYVFTMLRHAVGRRSRILMAVDDAAETVPATTSVSSPYVVAGTVAILAMSVLLLPLVAMAVAAPRLDRSPPPPRMLSFVERARLAGITIDSTPARAPGPLKPLLDRRPRAFDARALLERTLLQGDL